MKNISFLKENIFAHRGLHNEIYPENTIGAFKNALQKQIGIELDVHLLKDNTIVVFHDDNLIRMANKNINLKDVTYNEIKDIKLKNTEYTIPKLDEVLRLINGQVPLIVELKYDRKVGLLEEELFKQLDNYNGWFCVKSFNPLIMRYIRKKRKNYIRGLLIIKNAKTINRIMTNSKLFKLLAKPDFLSCDKLLYNNKKVIKYRKRMPILGWTIKTLEEQNKYKGFFDGIIIENIM